MTKIKKDAKRTKRLPLQYGASLSAQLFWFLVCILWHMVFQTLYKILAKERKNQKMRKRIIAAALAVAMMLAMPISAMATAKPDEWSGLIELEQTNATQYEPLGIKNHGSYAWRDGSTIYISYALEIENTNKNLAAWFPHIEIAVVAEDGSVIKTDDEYLDWVAEDDSYWYAGYFTYEYDGTIPAGIEMAVSTQDYNYQPSAGKEVLRSGELAVTNTSKRGSGYETRFTGKVTNNSAYKTSAKVIVLYKMKDESGEEVPVCGDIDYVLDIQPGETKNFEIHPYSGLSNYSSWEIVAIQM
nr:MAG TPA: protein of unknown function (DUF4179) [Caudoviricetes sp.]